MPQFLGDFQYRLGDERSNKMGLLARPSRVLAGKNQGIGEKGLVKFAGFLLSFGIAWLFVFLALRHRLEPKPLELTLIEVPAFEDKGLPQSSPWTQLDSLPDRNVLFVTDFTDLGTLGRLDIQGFFEDITNNPERWRIRSARVLHHFLIAHWDTDWIRDSATWGWKPISNTNLTVERIVQFAWVGPVNERPSSFMIQGLLYPSVLIVLGPSFLAGIAGVMIWWMRRRWTSRVIHHPTECILIVVMLAHLGLSWNGHTPWLDEWNTTNSAMRILREGKWIHPGSNGYIYGNMPILQQTAAAGAFFLRGMRNGGFLYLNPIDGQVYVPTNEGPRMIVTHGAYDQVRVQDIPWEVLIPSMEWSRYAMGIWTALSVLLIYLIGRRFLGPWGGLAAAALFAFWPDAVIGGKFTKPNAMAVFFPLLVHTYIFLKTQKNARTVFIAGLLTGLAMATRYQAAVVLASVWLAVLFDAPGKRLGYLMLSTMAAGLVFLVLSPGVLFDLPSFLNALGGVVFEYYYLIGGRYTSRSPRLFFLQYLFTGGKTYASAGWFVGGLGFLGISLLAGLWRGRWNRRDRVVLLGYPLMMFFVATGAKQWNIQHYYPLYPYLCLGFGAAMIAGFTWTKGLFHGRAWKTSLGVALALIVAFPCFLGFRFLNEYNRSIRKPTARTLAIEWLTQNVPFGGTVIHPFFNNATYLMDPVQIPRWLYRVVEVSEDKLVPYTIGGLAEAMVSPRPVPLLQASSLVRKAQISGERWGHDIHRDLWVYSFSEIGIQPIALERFIRHPSENKALAVLHLSRGRTEFLISGIPTGMEIPAIRLHVGEQEQEAGIIGNTRSPVVRIGEVFLEKTGPTELRLEGENLAAVKWPDTAQLIVFYLPEANRVEAGLGDALLPVSPIRIPETSTRTTALGTEDGWKRKPEVLIPFSRIEEAVSEWNPAWLHVQSADFTQPGLLDLYGGRPNILRLHPVKPDKSEPCRIKAHFEVPLNTPVLELEVAANDNPPGIIILRLHINGELFAERSITHPAGHPAWHDLVFDMAHFAGKEIDIVIEGWPEKWEYSALYLSHVRLSSSGGKADE